MVSVVRPAVTAPIPLWQSVPARNSTRPRLTWQHEKRHGPARRNHRDPELKERQRVIDVLRRREVELRARGLTRLALFGSTARGDAGPKSDVDLLIEVDTARRFGLFSFLDLKDDLARLLGRPVDLAFPDAIRPRLRSAVLRDAIEVF